MKSRHITLQIFILLNILYTSEGRTLEAKHNILITVQGKSIQIASPKGFYPSHGISSNFDEFLKAGTPKSALLASFHNEGDVTRILLDKLPTSGRGFDVKLLNSLANAKLSQQQFEELKNGLKKKTVPANDKVREIWNLADNNITGFLSKRLKDPVKLERGESVYLGVFNEGRSSISCTILTKIKMNFTDGDPSINYLLASSMTYLNIDGIVLTLYCESLCGGESDIRWTRDNSINWKEELIFVNLTEAKSVQQKHLPQLNEPNSKTVTGFTEGGQDYESNDAVISKIVGKTVATGAVLLLIMGVIKLGRALLVWFKRN